MSGNIDTSYAFTTTLELNKWYHIILMRSSGNLTLYVNGVAINTLTGVTQNILPRHYQTIGYSKSCRRIFKWLVKVILEYMVEL